MLPAFAIAALLAGVATATAAAPYLINAQQAGFATEPGYIRDHFQHINTLPFDGMVISTESGRLMMSGVARTENQIAVDFAPLNGLAFARLKQNFALVNVDRPADFFDDWSVTIENFRRFGKVLREQGIVGIFLDNEEYLRTLFNYPEDCDDALISLEEYRQQARLRGRQIAQAIVSEFPSIVIMAVHGPYSSFSGTPAQVHGGQTNWQTEELRGGFSVGMIEGMDSRSRFIDGGEVYTYRSASDFQISYDYRKTEIASSQANCPFIADYLRSIWPLKVGIGFGVYNHEYNGYPMDAATMRTTLEEALHRCDQYVWLYFEDQNWNAPGEIAQEWTEAILGAAAAAADPPYDPPPSVSITSPLAGAVINGPATISIEATASDAGGSIAKVEFFHEETSLGEDLSAPYQCTWPNLPAGSYTITAKATGGTGAVSTSGRITFSIAGDFVAAINFQPDGVTPPYGYHPDIGEVFGNRGNGLSYGWNFSHSDETRLRAGIGDLRLATFCHFRAGGVWEIAVPNGAYHVTVGIGDLHFASTHTINVEGTGYWNSENLQAGEFLQQSREVTVTDGALTIDQGAGAADDTRINFVLIAAAGALPATPSSLTVLATSPTGADLWWVDNSSNETELKIERSVSSSFATVTEIAVLPADTVNFQDTGLVPGTPYFYRIRAANSAGHSAFSNAASAIPPLPDVDLDRVPDSLEIAPSIVGADDRLVDSDGDGYSNVSEYVAGTNGTDSRSRPFVALAGIPPAANGERIIVLAFSTVASRNYFVDFTDSLSDDVWTMLPGSTRTGDGGTHILFDTTTSSGRLYRLQIDP